MSNKICEVCDQIVEYDWKLENGVCKSCRTDPAVKMALIEERKVIKLSELKKEHLGIIGSQMQYEAERFGSAGKLSVLPLCLMSSLLMSSMLMAGHLCYKNVDYWPFLLWGPCAVGTLMAGGYTYVRVIVKAIKEDSLKSSES